MHPDNRSTIPTIAPNNMAANIPRSAATEAAAFSCESVEFILDFIFAPMSKYIYMLINFTHN